MSGRQQRVMVQPIVKYSTLDHGVLLNQFTHPERNLQKPATSQFFVVYATIIRFTLLENENLDMVI